MCELESELNVTRLAARGKRPARRVVRRALLEGGAAVGCFDRPPSRSPRFNRALDRIDTAIADLDGSGEYAARGAQADALDRRAALCERRAVLLRQGANLLREACA